jgi:peptidoglycan/xylan/chitin deacetylase (PgdA/CDA1 family)
MGRLRIIPPSIGHIGSGHGLSVVGGGAALKILPQYLLNTPLTLVEGFETASEWLHPNYGDAVDNTSEFKSGLQSVKQSSSGVLGEMTKTINLDFSTCESIALWFYVHSPLANYADLAVRIRLSNDSGLANTYEVILEKTLMFDHTGWNYVRVPKNWVSVYAGAPTWSSPIIRLVIQTWGGNGDAASFDDMRISPAGSGVPALLLRFDDGYTSQYTTIFPLLKSHNIRGTLFFTTNGGGISWDHLREMAAAGWIIGNHTQTGTVLTTLSEADQEATIAGAEATLIAQGLPAGAKYVAYPTGASNADTMTAMANTGMLLGMHGASSAFVPGLLPFNNLYRTMGCDGIDSSISLATAQAKVDTAIANKTVLSLFFHGLDVGGQWDTATFTSFIEYVVSKRDEIALITVDDLYKLHYGAVSVQVPT